MPCKQCCVKVQRVHISSLDSTCFFLWIWPHAIRLCVPHCSIIHLMFVKAGSSTQTDATSETERAESTVSGNAMDQANSREHNNDVCHPEVKHASSTSETSTASATLTAQRSAAGTIRGENGDYFSSTPWAQRLTAPLHLFASYTDSLSACFVLCVAFRFTGMKKIRLKCLFFDIPPTPVHRYGGCICIISLSSWSLQLSFKVASENDCMDISCLEMAFNVRSLTWKWKCKTGFLFYWIWIMSRHWMKRKYTADLYFIRILAGL